MNVFDFRIRLRMIPDKIGKEDLFVDELPKDVRNYIISELYGEYDWLDRTRDCVKGSEDYLIQQEIMAQSGFTNDDIAMIAEYVDGKLNVSIMSDRNFEELRDVTYYGKIYKRTLIDCVKCEINGQLSDGIGENPIGTCTLGTTEYEVWLDEIETDSDTTEGKKYFKIENLSKAFL